MTTVATTVTEIPADLTELRQWVLWRIEERGGKLTKVPYQVNGKPASSTDLTTWSSYDDVVRVYQASRMKRTRYAGFGFVFFADDPFCGIDLDNCLEDNDEMVLKSWARPIVETFFDSYIEISPSGYGLHIFCKATLPGNGKKVAVEDGAIEMYDRGRYFTVTGNRYKDGFGRGVEDHQHDVEALYQRLSGDRPGPKANLHDTTKVVEGGRHDYLVSVAAQYRAKGMDRTEVLAAVKAVNVERCSPPKSDDELLKIVDWVCQKPSGRDKPSQPEPEVIEAEKLPQFPEAAWRGVFADYRAALTKTTEASNVYHFAALWAAAGVTLGRQTWMFSGERVFANVYFAMFGDTGDKKTTAQRLPISCGLLLPDVRVIRNQGSTEGLADRLAREDGSDAVTLFFWEELTSLFARGRWKGATILEFLTECFDCPPDWGLSYRGKNEVVIKAPTPSILAGTTPEWFWKNARGDDFYGGFGNRFLYLTGQKKEPMPNPEEPDPIAIEKVRDGLRRLQVIRSVQARFCPTAGRVWEKFYTDWEQKERTGLYAAAVKRIHVYVRKLAMTYAALEGTLPEINVEQLKAAITVGLYASECARLLVDSQNAAVRPEGELERKFLEWIKRHEGQRKRYMQQTMSKTAGSCEQFNRVLLALIRADQIEVADGRVYLPR